MWIEIVPLLPEEEANQKLDEWKSIRLANSEIVDEELIRCDHVFSKNRLQLVRYCVLEK